MIINIRLLKSTSLISFLFFGLLASCQNSKNELSIHENIQQQTDKIFNNLTEIRRDFHTYPELSEAEERTSMKIKDYLLSIGLEVKTNIGGHGVVGILRGKKEGKKIAWRADIDALKSDIPDVVDFESKNKGVRHICGHDVHATIGLGIANVMASLKEDFNGTVYFIFQPSEENYKGAKAMIDDGLFNIIDPEEIYGLHIIPLPIGTIATKSDAVYAHTNTIKITYKNSKANKSIIDYTKKLILSLQNIESDSKFWDFRNAIDPNIGLGNPNTVFKDYITISEDFSVSDANNQVTIKANINSSNKKQLDSSLELLKQKIRNSDYSKKIISVEYSYIKNIVLNDENLTNKSMNSISAIYGQQNVLPIYGVIPDNRGDDFAYFQNHTPGVYYLLGGSNFEKGIISMPHAPNYNVDEECIRYGVNYFSSMIIERLKD